MSETAIFLSVFIPTASFALLLYKGVSLLKKYLFVSRCPHPIFLCS
jgi:hypothetical protein